MRRLSMSRYPLALICGFPWSAKAPEWNERPAGREARVGSVTHHASEAHLKGVEPDFARWTSDEVADGVSIFEGSLRGWLAKTRWTHSELGIRYDAEKDESTNVAGRGVDGYDDADDGPMVMRGTLDLVHEWRDDSERKCIDVVDIKTGQPKNAHVEQLYVQGVAVSRLFDPHIVRVGFVYPRKTKVIEPVYDVLDRDRLDAEAGRIAKMLRMLPTAGPAPGDHCFRCPMGKGLCPAYEAPEMPADVAARFDEAG